MHSTTAKTLIEQLALARHPEGGWFKETYRASDKLAAQALPARFDGDRSASTAIYFLLEAGDISALHRIQSDEVWHFYAGSTLRVHGIFPDGTYQGGNSAPIWLRASSSRPWCLRAAGLAQDWPKATLPWWAARWHPVLTLLTLNWRKRSSYLPATHNTLN
jgi:predicted cupin superfamily sugar epimerase